MYRTIFIQRCCMSTKIVRFITRGKGVIFYGAGRIKKRIVDDYLCTL